MGAFIGLDASSPSLTVELLEEGTRDTHEAAHRNAATSVSSLSRRETSVRAPAVPTECEESAGDTGSTLAGTSAVTRSWSDVDPLKLMSTFALTSFTYSFLGQPFFLAISRQQCSKISVSAVQVVSEVYRTLGVRGLYRGAGVAISGTVLSELVYYFVVEYWKEKLPLKEREWRSFGAGLLADVASTPVFNPFAVVSQVQMVAGSSFSSEHNYMSAWRTTETLIRQQGFGCLFRGTLLTLAATPLTGAWWFVYELFKRHAYGAAPSAARVLGSVVPDTITARLPFYCTSTTDNVFINCGVGAAASMTLGMIMNPIYVLRLRVQVYKKPEGVRFPLIGITRDILLHEGPRALWKGLGVNLFVGVVGGCAFGLTYEGAKQFSDVADQRAASGGAAA